MASKRAKKGVFTKNGKINIYISKIGVLTISPMTKIHKYCHDSIHLNMWVHPYNRCHRNRAMNPTH